MEEYYLNLNYNLPIDNFKDSLSYNKNKNTNINNTFDTFKKITKYNSDIIDNITQHIDKIKKIKIHESNVIKISFKDKKYQQELLDKQYIGIFIKDQLYEKIDDEFPVSNNEIKKKEKISNINIFRIKQSSMDACQINSSISSDFINEF